MCWPSRGLMARFSLFYYTVAGGRTLSCRGVLALVPTGTSSLSIQKTARAVGSSMMMHRLDHHHHHHDSDQPHTTGAVSSSRGSAATSPWRQESGGRRESRHVHRLVTAPDGVDELPPGETKQKQLQQHPEQQQQQQQQSSTAAVASPTASASSAAAAATREEHRKTARNFRPDKKRMLQIPEEEWPSYPNFSFTVEGECKEGTKARVGALDTPHGSVQTPAFIFCATKAAIKGLSAETMKECGSQIILSNTYHLLVQPGGEMIEKMGGLQKATRWEGPMLTDSGGYQIFSMGHGSVGDEIKGRRGAEGTAEFAPSLVSISEKGARFKSYFDCSVKSLTPERSIEIQRQLGADLVVVLDECTPFHVDKDYTENSMHRTHRWAMRSLREFIDGDTGAQALYGIVQGGVYPDLRNEAVDFVNKAPFFGIAVGGSLGADKATMHEVVSQTMTNVRRDRPVHLLGIGGIADIFHGVRQGIDTFDCVHPTRLGRHGGALVKARFWEIEQERERQEAEQQQQQQQEAAAAAEKEKEKEEEGVREGEAGAAGAGTTMMSGGKKNKKRGGNGRNTKPQPVVPKEHANLLKGRYEDDHRVIDEDCGCPTCRGGYTRAYIHHLGKAGELLGGMLVSQHNVFFMNDLMTSIRKAISEGRLEEEEDKWLAPGLRSRDYHKRAAEAGEAVAAAARTEARGAGEKKE